MVQATWSDPDEQSPVVSVLQLPQSWAHQTGPEVMEDCRQTIVGVCKRNLG
ncbi:hypothetical protein DEDE109153_06990 [Deinococcus deserti]